MPKPRNLMTSASAFNVLDLKTTTKPKPPHQPHQNTIHHWTKLDRVWIKKVTGTPTTSLLDRRRCWMIPTRRLPQKQVKFKGSARNTDIQQRCQRNYLT